MKFNLKLQGAENELEDTFALSSMKTLEEAVKTITQFLGMQPCERSDVPEGKSGGSHHLPRATSPLWDVFWIRIFTFPFLFTQLLGQTVETDG